MAPRAFAPVAFAVLIALAVPLPTGAEEPKQLSQYVHDRWNQRDGLPHNLVEGVVASRKGYLWLGTQEGLVRFDGVRFRVFDRLGTPGLAGDEVFSLHEDPSGDLWIGTSSGLSRMRGERFEAIDTGDGGPIAIHSLESDGRDLWAGTRKGLRRFRNGSWSSVRGADGLPDDGISALSRAPGGGLWIGTRRGLARWTGERVEPVSGLGLPSELVRSVLEDAEGILWVGTTRGLARRLPGRTSFELVADVGDREISSLLSDRAGALWISSTSGMLRLASGRVETLPGRTVISNGLAEDADGSIWFGTATDGLHRVGRGNVVVISKDEGLSSDVVWAVAPGNGGSVWIAGEGGLDRTTGVGVPTPVQRDATRGINLTALLEDRSGDLWVGTETHGLLRIGAGGAKGPRRFGAAEGLRSMVRVIFQDGAGTVWVGARDGLHRLGPEGFELFASTSGLVNTIQEEGGSLWLGTTAGLFRTEGRYLVPVPLKGWSGQTDVTALRFEKNGTLWIGTIGAGLWRLRNGREFGYTKRQGMHENNAFAILDDGLGNLWLSGNHGLTRVSREELDGVADGKRTTVAVTVLGRADGMKEPECSGGIQPSAFRAPDGRLWFATIRGVVVVDPGSLTFNPRPPPVILEEVMADGRRYPPTEGLRLPPGTRHLAIRYTGLGLAGADRIRFRHRLDGLDEDFLEAGGERVAHYAGLAPGRYVFRVTAANENGVWNPSGAALAFEIEPHAWQATWVRFLALAVAVALVVAAFQARVRRLHAQERRLNVLVEEKTSALAEAKRNAEEASRLLTESNQMLERLSRSDPLTGLANRREFDLVLREEWRRCRRAGLPLAEIMIDIDHFKAFNDSFGHQTGDDCLKWVAATLAGGLRRAGDVVARYGGEEFVVLLPSASAAEALSIAESLRTLVQGIGIEHVYPVPGSVVTVSAGVASFVPGEGPPEALTAAADTALYDAKRQGRNRTVAAL
jgi:diguanylate cyclase (GGDEF)-like protein